MAKYFRRPKKFVKMDYLDAQNLLQMNFMKWQNITKRPKDWIKDLPVDTNDVFALFFDTHVFLFSFFHAQSLQAVYPGSNISSSDLRCGRRGPCLSLFPLASTE